MGTSFSVERCYKNWSNGREQLFIYSCHVSFIIQIKCWIALQLWCCIKVLTGLPIGESISLSKLASKLCFMLSPPYYKQWQKSKWHGRKASLLVFYVGELLGLQAEKRPSEWHLCKVKRQRWLQSLFLVISFKVSGHPIGAVKKLVKSIWSYRAIN